MGHTEISVINARPTAAALAVVNRGRHILLVRRAHSPDAGRWCFPGGKIEFGETIRAAAIRELREETHVHAAAGRILTATDAFGILHDATQHQHFIALFVCCHWISGEPLAGDDALDARWVEQTLLDRLELARCVPIQDVVRLVQRPRR